MEDQHATVCFECGGSVVPITKPGRTAQYRGRRGFVIPSELELQTCQSCGDYLVTMDVAEALDEAFEEQFRLRFPHADMDVELGRPNNIVRAQDKATVLTVDHARSIVRASPTPTRRPIEFTTKAA